jgi:citrate synthase
LPSTVVLVNIEESTLTESTALLSSAQAAARLGVKPATLYAYVSRGLLVRHPSPDGRRSLFDPADVDRLERRSAGRHGAPSDVIVGSELALVDPAERSLWYRGVDALQLAREHSFEAVCALLWAPPASGRSRGRRTDWHADAPTSRVATRSQSGLARGVSAVDRLSVCTSAIASTHLHTGPRELMACLVDVLPASQSSGDERFAVRLWTKLTTRPVSQAWVVALDATLSLLCAPRLTTASRAARVAAQGGTPLASSVASAMYAAVAPVDAYAAIETALATASGDGTMRAADALDPDAWTAAFSRDPYRTGDPRTNVLLSLVAAVAPDDVAVANALSDELRRRGADHPTASYAAAVLSWSAGMRPGSGAVIARLANVAAWIAHALEEYRLPTPYRLRLAYTGPAPQGGTATTPRRQIDAVLDYLARE